MKKLALKLDDLRVDSFSTSGTVTGRGTVRGNAETEWECTDGPPRVNETAYPCFATLSPEDCQDDTKSKYWSCVCNDSGIYTCEC